MSVSRSFAAYTNVMPQIKHAQIRFRIIDKCLRNKFHPYPSKEFLREQCEEALFGSDEHAHICPSTIEKDLFSMRMEFDAPVKWSKKYGGYFYTDPDFSIDNIPLSENDLESISFAAKTLMQFRNSDLFRQFGSAIEKISDRINLKVEGDTGQFIQFEAVHAAGGSEYLAPLFKAIKEEVWVLFDYASFKSGERKRRKVIPLLLKQYRNRWYLISFDPDKNAYTTYALDRMNELELSQDPFKRPSDFDPDNFFRYAVGISNSNLPPENVEMKASKVASKYLESLPLHHSQVMNTKKDGEATISLSVGISEELIREILSFGGSLQVLKPEHLRDEVRKRAMRLLE